ncbi:MAG TPA: TlpA disulfide reductase family protein [Acidimicrobiales bacterium]|nr:TlpA disulfide reductase family protein [Acidimicrobiales bacterium]
MILAPGTIAPTFDLPASDGDRVRLSLADLNSEGPALLAFFKSSCPVCRLSFPIWGELARRYGTAVAVVAVSQDPLAKGRSWLDDTYFFAPVVDDSHGFAASRAYGVETVPTLVLIGADGRIVDASQGWDRKRANDWDVTLAELTGLPSAGPVSTSSDGLPAYRPG